MTDISKCHGHDHPACDGCWRKLAPAGEYQSWFATPPNPVECEFWITRKVNRNELHSEPHKNSLAPRRV